jgi:hypothetical protein
MPDRIRFVTSFFRIGNSAAKTRRLSGDLGELLLRQPDLFDWKPRYNIAPTQLVAAVWPSADVAGRELVPLK